MPVALSSGVRAGELLSMTRGGVDAGLGMLSVLPKGGGGVRVWVPAAPEALVLVCRYAEDRLHHPRSVVIAIDPGGQRG